MWTVYLDTNPLRMTGTRVLGLASRRAYFGPMALLRTRDIGQPALPGRRWVRVRNQVAGISDEDVDLIHLEVDPRETARVPVARSGSTWAMRSSGRWWKIGPEVEFLRAGDRVAFQLDQCCATREIEPPCRHCAAGNYSLCESRTLPGPQAIGGGWGDEMVVHERQLFLVPDSLTDDQAALIEPCAIAVHTVLRHQPQPGEQVLVIGTATAGLLAIQAARALVPNALIAALPSETFQVEMAARMGTTRILYPEEGTAGVARMTGARHTQPRTTGARHTQPRTTGARHTQPRGAEQLIGGFDVIYDTVGSAESIRNAMRWACDGATIVLSSRRIQSTELDLSPIWRKELSLRGAPAHGTENWPRASSGAGFGAEGGRVSSFALASALIRERKLTPDRLITHRFPLMTSVVRWRWRATPPNTAPSSCCSISKMRQRCHNSPRGDRVPCPVIRRRATRVRLAILSDVHGNLIALDTVLAELAAQGIERVVCLGDVALAGPQPRQVIERVQALGCPIVRGNCDARMLHPEPGDPPMRMPATFWRSNTGPRANSRPSISLFEVRVPGAV